MQLNSTYVQASRPILVPPDNTQEVQTLFLYLLKISKIHFKYILDGTYSDDKIDRYIECIKELYPVKSNTEILEQRNQLINWINDKQGRGFVVTWHNE